VIAFIEPVGEAEPGFVVVRVIENRRPKGIGVLHAGVLSAGTNMHSSCIEAKVSCGGAKVK